MIYAMQPVGGGPIKIGYSENVEARRAYLERELSCPLMVLRTLPGDATEEAEIHERFAHLRFGRTEQFRPEPDLLEFFGLADGEAKTGPCQRIKGKVNRVRNTVTNVRSTPEWKDWLARFADSERMDLVDLIDEAVAFYASEKGFEKPPKR